MRGNMPVLVRYLKIFLFTILTMIVLTGKIVFLGAQGSGYSSNAGKLLWKYEYLRMKPDHYTESIYMSSPTVFENLVIAPLGNEDIVALSLETGKEVWVNTTNNPNQNTHKPAATLWRGRIFTPDNYYYPGGVFKGELDCLDAATGKLLWQFKTPAGEDPNVKYSRRQIAQPPVIKNDKLYFTDFQGVIYCLNPLDGSLIWKTDINVILNKQSPSSGGFQQDAREFEEPFFVGEKSLCATDNDGHLISVDLETGRENWSKTFTVYRREDICLLDVFRSRVLMVYMPWRMGASLLAHKIYAFDEDSGRTLWESKRLPGSDTLGAQLLKNEITVTNINALFGTDSRTNYETRIDLLTGKIKSSKRRRTYSITPGYIVDGRRYDIRYEIHPPQSPDKLWTATFNEVLYCDDAVTGKTIWKYGLVNNSNDWYREGTEPRGWGWRLSFHDGKAFAVTKAEIYCIDLGKPGLNLAE